MKISIPWQVRVALAAAILLLLAYALLRESHPVRPLAGVGGEKTLGGADFIEAASYDGLMRQDQRLYDIFTLTPEVLQEKDCKT
jgi:hypothetical protein